MAILSFYMHVVFLLTFLLFVPASSSGYRCIFTLLSLVDEKTS